jgi:hypothetical protein
MTCTNWTCSNDGVDCGFLPDPITIRLKSISVLVRKRSAFLCESDQFLAADARVIEEQEQ